MISTDAAGDGGTWRERLVTKACRAGTSSTETEAETGQDAALFPEKLADQSSIECDMVLALGRAPSTVDLKVMAEQRVLRSILHASDVSARQEQNHPAAPASSSDDMTRWFVCEQQMLRSDNSPSRAHEAPSRHNWAGKKLSSELACSSKDMARWFLREQAMLRSTISPSRVHETPSEHADSGDTAGCTFEPPQTESKTDTEKAEGSNQHLLHVKGNSDSKGSLNLRDGGPSRYHRRGTTGEGSMLRRHAMQVLQNLDLEEFFQPRQGEVGDEDAKVAGNKPSPRDASTECLTVKTVPVVVTSPSVTCAIAIPSEAVESKLKREQMSPSHSHHLSSKVPSMLEALSADDLNLSMLPLGPVSSSEETVERPPGTSGGSQRHLLRPNRMSDTGRDALRNRPIDLRKIPVHDVKLMLQLSRRQVFPSSGIRCFQLVYG